MIRRTFLMDDTPFHLERFKNEKIMLYEMDNNMFIEYIQGHYYSLIFDDNYITIDRIKLNGYPKKVINKIRYYIPLNDDLDAKIDYCSDEKISPTISVDFSSIEEANNFEIPNWFGNELLLEIKSKKQKIRLKG